VRIVIWSLMVHLVPAAARSVEDFSALVSDIYDTVLDPSGWPGVLAGIAAYVGGPTAALFAKDAAAKTGSVYYDSGGIDDAFKRLYFEKYVKLDPATTAHYFMGIGDVGATDDLLAYADFVETRFYREWAVPQGLVDFITTVIDKSTTRATMLGVFRAASDGVADEGARGRLRLVSPHVRRAVLIGEALDRKTSEVAALGEMIDAVRSGMMLLAEHGRIVHANAAACELIAAGNVVKQVEGRLRASDPEAARGLAVLLDRCCENSASLGHGGVALPLVDRSGTRYVASLLPLASGARRAASANLAAVAMLLVHRAELSVPAAPEVIAKSFGLTPSELRVLLAVLEVGGVGEVAEALGIAESTVRFHLKRLFEKTGTHRQADLVKLAVGFASPFVG
jgi:DNA-binding CsgD family transcriptional regulator